MSAVDRPGIYTFLLVWSGQVVSLAGSGLTEFALGVWVYQSTGSAMQFALTVFFLVLPRILLSPLAGALVDRWDRRWVMILSDTGAGLATLFVAGLLFSGRLQVWGVYAFVALSSAFGTFQRPAYTASVTLLVPKKHFGRANGLIQTGGSVASLASPLLAGFLMVAAGIETVLLVDVATFLVAVTTLALVRIPAPPAGAETVGERTPLWRQALEGWRYITQRAGLLGLLVVYAGTSFLGITTEVLLTPYLLTISTVQVLGAVVSATGAGLLVGGLVMTAWGGPRRKVYGIFGFEMLVGVCTLVVGLVRNPAVIGAAVFAYFVFIALSDSCSLSLWQAKVAPGFQGRVFALRQMISLSALPLGLLVTAPLAEYVFEPMLAVDGALAGSVGRITGVGPGRGIALVFILTGFFNLLVLAGGFVRPRVRLLEQEIPDAV